MATGACITRLTSNLTRPTVAAISLTLCLASSTTVLAQSADSSFEQYHPDLAALFNTINAGEVQVLSTLQVAGSSPDSKQARDAWQQSLQMQARMSMAEMMESGHSMAMHTMAGPMDEFDSAARMELAGVLRQSHSASDVNAAFENSNVLGGHAAAILQRGNSFKQEIYNIYADSSISDKQVAVAAAVEEYLSDPENSVPTAAKNPDLLRAHAQANGFYAGYPKVSGLLWSGQWLKLASLEAMMLAESEKSDESDVTQYDGGVNLTLQRFWEKVGSETGMSMFPVPVELPMSPAIAPQLYSMHPEVAIIFDNLNMLEAVITDILAYPNVDDTSLAINNAAEEFSNHDSNLVPDMVYLLSALRGGIFNQGGPAIGDLSQSERNRTRSNMNMQHSGTMPGPM